MSEDKPKPVDDLKEGLGLLFRAAKGAVQSLPTEKVEKVATEAVGEVNRAFESIGSEIQKVISGKPQSSPPPPAPQANTNEAPPAEEQKYDDGYAPEPPKGPRVG
ncbi:MAG: hypothetical protein KIT84_14905 [Labilithrix sp.]|nr:hypothetical protein [Labilithrix sp.]MCW5812312.1 hypothetical protein [Labilithrix sp.]